MLHVKERNVGTILFSNFMNHYWNAKCEQMKQKYVCNLHTSQKQVFLIAFNPFAIPRQELKHAQLPDVLPLLKASNNQAHFNEKSHDLRYLCKHTELN